MNSDPATMAGSVAYEYDLLGRLSRVRHGDQTTTFSFDNDDVLVAPTPLEPVNDEQSVEIIHYVCDENGHLRLRDALSQEED